MVVHCTDATPSPETRASRRHRTREGGVRAGVLDAAGIRNTTGEGTITGAPIAFLLNELVYRGTADLAVKAKQGKKAKAKLAK